MTRDSTLQAGRPKRHTLTACALSGFLLRLTHPLSFAIVNHYMCLFQVEIESPGHKIFNLVEWLEMQDAIWTGESVLNMPMEVPKNYLNFPVKILPRISNFLVGSSFDRNGLNLLFLHRS